MAVVQSTFSKEALLVFTVFSKELFGIQVGSTRVDCYQLMIAVAGLVWYLEPRRTPGLLLFAPVLTLGSACVFWVNGYDITLSFIKQSIAVSVVYTGIGAYILSCSEEKIARAYLSVTYWIALIGIGQVILSIVGIHILVKVPGRLDSLCQEPSHYVVATAPCLYYHLRYSKTFPGRLRAAVVLTSLILTVSATGAAVFLFIVALAFLRTARVGLMLLLSSLAPLSLLFIPWGALPDVITSRFESMVWYFQEAENPWDVKNATVLSFVANMHVAVETISEGRFWGNGFCGHPQAYASSYAGSEFEEHRHYGMNSPAAHCLAIRILSEFGLPGVCFALWVLWVFLTRKRSNLWCMFLLATFAARSLKLGSWVDYGMPMFILSAVYFGGFQNHCEFDRTSARIGRHSSWYGLNSAAE